MSDYQSYGENRTEQLRVTIYTPGFMMEGFMHLSKTSRPERRLTNMLNSDRRFLPLTQVEVTNRLNNEKEETVYPYLQINMQSIELIKPYPAEESQ